MGQEKPKQTTKEGTKPDKCECGKPLVHGKCFSCLSTQTKSIDIRRNISYYIHKIFKEVYSTNGYKRLV